MSAPIVLRSWFLFGAAPASPVRVDRDVRVDIFRGLSLLIIFVDHVAGNVLTRITPTSMGFSDAAEYFVLLAGFSAALAYGSVIDRRSFVTGSAQVVARIWKLYLAHLGLFVFTAVAVAFMAVRFGNPLYYEHVSILPFFQDPATTLLQTAALIFLPNYLDILPLYVVLLAMLPVLWVMARIAPVLAVSASVGLYAASWWFGLAIPNMSTGGAWFFNPFAWQLLFTVGMITGHGALRGVALPRAPWITIAAVAIVLFGLVSAAPWAVIAGFEGVILPDQWRLDLDKTNLSLWRLAHALSLAYLVAAHVPRTAAWLSSAVARLLEQAGRHSLPLFCFGVILSLLGTFAFTEIGRGPLMQIAVNAIGIVLLLATAQMFEWYRTSVARAPAKSPPGTGEVKVA
ncbi:MAG: OpgC domain-containing protein [Phreatobacter sp.]|nr:OpgC domain-containing protein [Phreatobacter sp.]